MGHWFWPDTLLKNLYNIQTIMWVNSVSWFVKVKFTTLMRVHLIWNINLKVESLLKNLCHVQEIMWVNSSSSFDKVHFGVLMGHIQYGPLLLA